MYLISQSTLKMKIWRKYKMSYSKVKTVRAKYNTYLHWDIENIAESYKFNVDDIKQIQVGKWTDLIITLKDDTVIVDNSKTDGISLWDTDWKWSDKVTYEDECFEEFDYYDLEYDRECLEEQQLMEEENADLAR